MTVLDKLSGALDRRDEATQCRAGRNHCCQRQPGGRGRTGGAVRIGPVRQANDAIKVLYEIGARNPELIAAQCPVFSQALRSTNNRQVWGAMTAIDTVAERRADALVAELPAIIDAADKGSVIAKDHCNSILVKLARAGYGDRAVPILVERLRARRAQPVPQLCREDRSRADAGNPSWISRGAEGPDRRHRAGEQAQAGGDA